MSSSDSDTSNTDNSLLVNYLVSLSTCPTLVSRRKVPKNVKNARRRRHNHSWDVVGGICRNFPASIDPQILGSNSNSSTETMKSGLASGNFSQDSLDEAEEADNSFSLAELFLQQMSTSFESDSLIAPAQVSTQLRAQGATQVCAQVGTQVHAQMRSQIGCPDLAQVRAFADAQTWGHYGDQGPPSSLSINDISDCPESDLERELSFLEEQLYVATKMEAQVEQGRRACWLDPSRVVKSWSSELAGNFLGNDKVKFSYENIISPSLLPICESSLFGHHHHLRQNSVCSDEQASTYSLPEPVESAVKFLERVRHNSTHDKFSPKPLRRRLTSDDRSISANSSSCNFPVKTHRRASSLSRDIEGGVSVGGGAGAVGVTSMWIPVTSSDRRRYRPTSPTPSQSSFCSLPSSSSSVSTSGLWTGNATKISLTKKVFLHHQLLPNKTEGRRKERTTD